MYLPRAFADTDLSALDALVEANPFVTLISRDEQGEPFVSHLPILYRREGERVRIEGHWAGPNPQSRHDPSMLMIVHGPNAYVSPSWYPDKESAARVPTWNYAVAHLHGALRLFDDETSLADLVSRLSAHFEATIGGDWRFEAERETQRSQLRGIIGFEFEPERVMLKFKLNQNHPEANRRAVAGALATSGDAGARTIAAWMQSRDPSSFRD